MGLIRLTLCQEMSVRRRASGTIRLWHFREQRITVHELAA